MLVDLHVHTSRYSNCGKASPDEILAAATDAGLGGVVFAEHSFVWPAAERRLLAAKYPKVHVFRAAELNTDDSKCDIVALGIPDDFEIRLGWRPHEIVRAIHAGGGFATLAHPFRLAANVPAELLIEPPDAYEVATLNMPIFARQKAQLLARLFPDARPVVASDGHQTAGIGAYAIQVDDGITDEGDLAAAIRGGAYRISVNRERLRQRAPHWQRIQERIGDIAKTGAPYVQVKRDSGYDKALVRYVMAGGDLRE